jgi:hypothetical protein
VALALANTAEGVTTGTALTTTLSASGGNAFDTVTQGTGATLQASTVQASNGTDVLPDRPVGDLRQHAQHLVDWRASGR